MSIIGKTGAKIKSFYVGLSAFCQLFAILDFPCKIRYNTVN